MTSEEMADDETKEKIQEIATKSKITGKNYKMMFSDRKVQEIFCTFK